MPEARSVRPRRLARLLVPTLAVVTWAAVSPAAHAVGAATTPRTVLLRDVRAGYDKLGAVLQQATPGDYIQPDTQIEPSIAVNPANPLNVVTGYQEGRVAAGGDATNGYATTFDGGRTWTFGEIPSLTSIPGGGGGGPFDRGSDAVVAFGPDNVVYFSSLVFNDTTGAVAGTGLRSGMAVNVSYDGGRTWSQPAFFQDDNLAGLNDKNWIVVDQSSAPGHHRGRVYVLWDRVAPILYSYCDARCEDPASWLANPGLAGQHFIPLPAYVNQGIGCIPMVLPDGSLGVVLNSDGGTIPPGATSGSLDPGHAGSVNLVFIEAPSAGSIPYPAPLVWNPAAIGIAYNLSNGVRAQRAGGLPSADVDHASGRIYVAWEDGRLRTDGDGAENDILVSTSGDGGTHWSAPSRVNPGPENDHVDRYNAMIGVSPDGVVHAAYLQRQEGAHLAQFSKRVDTYYQESYDHGTTWTAPLKVNTPVNDINYAAFSRTGAFQGDYNELASAGGLTYIVRTEAYAAYPGEPEALTPNPDGTDTLVLADPGKGHQHQQTWVAVVGPESARTSSPSSNAPAGSTTGAAAAGLANTSGATPAAAATVLGLLVLVAAPRWGRGRR